MRTLDYSLHGLLFHMSGEDHEVPKGTYAGKFGC